MSPISDKTMRDIKKWRELVCAETAGKVVKSMEWPDDGYCVLTFTDGTEMGFQWGWRNKP